MGKKVIMVMNKKYIKIGNVLAMDLIWIFFLNYFYYMQYPFLFVVNFVENSLLNNLKFVY